MDGAEGELPQSPKIACANGGVVGAPFTFPEEAQLKTSDAGKGRVDDPGGHGPGQKAHRHQGATLRQQRCFPPIPVLAPVAAEPFAKRRAQHTGRNGDGAIQRPNPVGVA